MHYSSLVCNFIVAKLLFTWDIISDEVLTIDLPEETRDWENKKLHSLPPFSNKFQPLINVIKGRDGSFKEITLKRFLHKILHGKIEK